MSKWGNSELFEKQLKKVFECIYPFTTVFWQKRPAL